MIEREDVCNGIVEIFGLVQKCLAVKSGEVFIEIHREEINAGGSILQRLGILSDRIVIVLGRLGGQRSNLLIASSIPRYEQHRNPFHLGTVSQVHSNDMEALPSDSHQTPLLDKDTTSICSQNEYVPYRSRQNGYKLAGNSTFGSPWGPAAVWRRSVLWRIGER